MCLLISDSFGLICLIDNIDSLINVNVDFEGFEVFIEGDKEVRVYGCDEEVEKVVWVVSDEVFWVDYGDISGEKVGSGDVRENLVVVVEGVKGKSVFVYVE